MTANKKKLLYCRSIVKYKNPDPAAWGQQLSEMKNFKISFFQFYIHVFCVFSLTSSYQERNSVSRVSVYGLS